MTVKKLTEEPPVEKRPGRKVIFSLYLWYDKKNKSEIQFVQG